MKKLLTHEIREEVEVCDFCEELIDTDDEKPEWWEVFGNAIFIHRGCVVSVRSKIKTSLGFVPTITRKAGTVVWKDYEIGR